MSGTLYIVPTPIGNLEDITLRALRILKEVDLVLCEDTRVTKKLLDHYEISIPTKSYHAHSSDGREEEVVGLLKEGKNIALVSDAGTPTISDPGIKLIVRVEQELGKEAKIVPLPGASALTTAVSGAAETAAEFTFLGFLPHKKGRETLFKEIAEGKRTYVFYESPHRIMKTLERLAELLPETRRVVIARELTKIYEEFLRGSAKEVFALFTEHPDKVRGEFVVIVGA